MKRTSLALLAVITLAGCTGPGPQPTPVATPPPKPGLQLAMQAWTFNNLTFLEAVERTAALGVKLIEAFPGQKIGGDIEGSMTPDLDAAQRAQVLAKLKAAGVTLVNFGVANAGDEAEWRKLFDFAKAMGIATIVSEPNAAQMELVDKLCAEYKINIAIHNHPKESPYWNPEIVLAAVKDRSRRLGACADTGHWLRSGLDPLACLKQLEGRIVSLHLKDLSWKGPNAHDVPWGTGVSHMPAMLAELKRQKFSGVVSIEYENNNPELMSNVARCVAYFKACVPLSAPDLLLHKALVPGMSRDPADVWKQMKPADDGKWTTNNPAAQP